MHDSKTVWTRRNQRIASGAVLSTTGLLLIAPPVWKASHCEKREVRTEIRVSIPKMAPPLEAVQDLKLEEVM
jgi:hypothetical protein